MDFLLKRAGEFIVVPSFVISRSIDFWNGEAEEVDEPPARRPADSDRFYMVFAKKVNTFSKPIAATSKKSGVTWLSLP